MNQTYEMALAHEQAHGKIAQQVMTAEGLEATDKCYIELYEGMNGWSGRFWSNSWMYGTHSYNGHELSGYYLMLLAGVYHDCYVDKLCMSWDDLIDDLDFHLYEDLWQYADNGSTDAESFLNHIGYDEWEGTCEMPQDKVIAYLQCVEELYFNSVDPIQWTVEGEEEE